MSNMFRDLVEGECSEPNAFGGFVQQFTSDKSGLYHDKWEMGNENELYHGLEQDNGRFYDNHLDKYFDGENKIDDINDMLDRTTIGDNYREDFMQHPLHQSGVESDLQFFFQDFIMSTKANHLMKPMQININLDHTDKVKIRNRSEVMFKHFRDPELDNGTAFNFDQLNILFDSLGITDEDKLDEGFDEHWEQANHFDLGPVTTTTTTTTGPQPFGDLQDEYFKNDVPHQILSEDFETNFDETWDNYEQDNESDGELWNQDQDMNIFESAWKNSGAEFEDHSLDAAWDETARKSIRDVTRPITNIQDPKIQSSKFYKFMNQLNTGEAEVRENEGVIFHGGMETDNSAIDLEQPGAWESEYQDFHEESRNLDEYRFSISEARDDDTFERGMDLFNQGNIDDSIIALESEVKRNPENSEAWMYLGIAHAENDKDQQAITCLTKAVQLDPDNLTARVSLAVSYTNDYQKERALDTLQEWLKRSPEYSHIAQNMPQENLEGDEVSFMDTWKRHTFVTDMYLDAARMRPNNPDPNVQTVLGLLFNMSYDYQKAVDCFKAALQNRPDDYQLWNKLGATLANSNRGQEAIGAYFKALEIKPGYVRARSNLGIAYLSLNMFQEAAQSFLAAVHIHPGAVHIWDNLKMVFRLMGREDLIAKSESRNTALFEKDFHFM